MRRRKKKPPPPSDPPSFNASMTLDLDVLDSISPKGRGKRLDATFRDDFEEKKLSVNIPLSKKPKP